MDNTKGTNDVMDNSTSIALVGILVFIVIIVLLVRFFIGGGRTSAVTNGTEITRPIPSCKTWERMYGVVESHTVSSDIFEVGSNATWVVPLDTLDTLVWSDWMKSNYKYWSVAVGPTEIQTPDGRIFVDAPGKYIVINQKWDKIRFRNNECVLFTTNERVYNRWRTR